MYQLLAVGLREQFGLEALPAVARMEYGKPFFLDHPHIHFSLSHSGPYALCALSDGCVGADIEVVRPRKGGLPRYCLTEAEFGRWDGTWAGFYALWTAREAWSKYTGLGVARSRHRDVPPLLAVTAFAGAGWRGSVCAGEAAGPVLWR